MKTTHVLLAIAGGLALYHFVLKNRLPAGI